MSHGYNIQANWACLSNPSRQNLGSQKATAEDPPDSEAEDSDVKNENTPTKGAKKGEIPLIPN